MPRARGLIFVCAVLFLSHLPYLDLPYFWDELGQFVPAALDIRERGAWIPQSTLPNVHPPGVMAYLAGIWPLLGTSVVSTRIAMLLLAALGIWSTWLLAEELGGAGFWSCMLLLVSPLFYMQSMMAQLDMP